MGAMAGRHIARRRVLPALTAALAMVGPVASFFVPPQRAARDMVAPAWGAVAARQRERGAVNALIINPKRAGVKEVGIEDIKAKRAALQPPPGLEGSILVTGTLEEEVYTLLNEQRVWERITALSGDPLLARKRLTSRSTRYSGLLDLLSFQEGDAEDLSQVEALIKKHGYDAWLDIHTDADANRLLAKAKLVASSGVRFFVTTVSVTQQQIEAGDYDLEPVAQVLRAANVRFHILVTGPVLTGPATGFVRLNDTGGLLPNATITRGDLTRIATEFFLVTDKPDATCIYATQGDEAVAGYLRYCREQGMNYKMEIHDQLQGGLYTYKDRIAAVIKAEEEKSLGFMGRGKKDSEVYAAYRQNVTRAGIASEFEKKRRTLVGMVKKIVDDLLEEEYDDMYYSMRTKDDLDLYKKANWQRAVNLVLGMLMQAGTKSKMAQKMTGFQDPYLGPQWHVIKSNAAVIIKIKELYDEIGERLTKEDWEKYEMLEGDFMGDEEAVLAMKIEEKTRRNKNYLRDTLAAPPRRKASLVVETEDIDAFKEAARTAEINKRLAEGPVPAAAGALPVPLEGEGLEVPEPAAAAEADGSEVVSPAARRGRRAGKKSDASE